MSQSYNIPVPMSQSLEDYLEAIYVLTLEKKVARVKDVSGHLGVKKPSVNNAARELAGRGLVVHEKYGYIELTQEGEREARRILGRHRMITGFFRDVLGVSEEVSEKDACRVEHCLSDETVSKMEEYWKREGRGEAPQ